MQFERITERNTVVLTKIARKKHSFFLRKKKFSPQNFFLISSMFQAVFRKSMSIKIINYLQTHKKRQFIFFRKKFFCKIIFVTFDMFQTTDPQRTNTKGENSLQSERKARISNKLILKKFIFPRNILIAFCGCFEPPIQKLPTSDSPRACKLT